MKISKELDDALQAISKEVEAWPQWKRSIDPQDNQCLTSASREISRLQRPKGDEELRLSARAAKA